MSASTIPPPSFMGASGGGVTGSYRPPTAQPQPNQYQNQVNENLMDSEGNPIDASSLFMFTTVGYVGLHFVLRPLFRWGIRSLMLPAKSYYDDKTVSKKSKSKSKLKIDPIGTDTTPDSSSAPAATMNGEKPDPADPSSQSSPAASTSNLKRRKKRVLLCNSSTGVCGPYGEVVATFGALTAISTFAHPNNVLLYFGVLYPSYPFILRCFDTVNDKKSRLTISRTSRMAGKAFVTTGGFALSMVFVGYWLQTVPFLNVLGLTFWDCVADFLISDGPDN